MTDEDATTTPANQVDDAQEEMKLDESTDASAPKNAFHERLDESTSNHEADFAATMDEIENPYLADQLSDPALQEEAEADYE